MRRKFSSFDEGVTDKEFFSLPERDQAKLASILEQYEMTEESNTRPAIVKDYGEGLYMIRHERAAYQGRCLFFRYGVVSGVEQLMIVAFYKKESDSIPKQILDRAVTRMKRFKETQ